MYIQLLFVVAGCFGGYALYRKMPKAGSLLFRIGYTLYTRTRLGYFYYRRELTGAREKYGDQQHSHTEPTHFDGLLLLPIAMSNDNYAYLVTEKSSNICVLIDPANPEAVQPAVSRVGATVSAVLTTHRHWDHSAGNQELKRKYRNIAIYGGEKDNVPHATHPVKEGDVLRFGQMTFHVIWTPGHTYGHVVYMLDGAPFNAPNCLFSGDHIFLGGAGRMFECSPATMLNSLDKILTLPKDTLLWPGHEYSDDNLNFACHIQPDNEEAKAKQKHIKQLRSNKLCTSPSTLGEERSYNPFLRVDQPSLQQTLGVSIQPQSTRDDVRAEALALCRKRKDSFKYTL